MKVGDRVRQKKGVKPTHAWGIYVKGGDVGVVKNIEGEDVSVDFPSHPRWHGRISEMEVVTEKPDTFHLNGLTYYFPNGVPSLKDVYDTEPCEDQWEIFHETFGHRAWTESISTLGLVSAIYGHPSWLSWMIEHGLVAEYHPGLEKKPTVMVKGQEVAIEDLVDTNLRGATEFGNEMVISNRMVENLANKGFFLSPIAMWDVITDKAGIQVLVAVEKQGGVL